MVEKTNMTPDWIARTWADNPCELLSNGNIRFLARLAFANVTKQGKPPQGKEEGGWGVVALIPDLSLLPPEPLAPIKSAIVELIKENAPAALTNQALASKLHKPLKDQGSFVNTKDPNGALYDGFTAGRLCISANTGTKPPAVDMRMAPLVGENDVYSGCWAFVTIVPKWFDKGVNKGPTFYLQSVMKIADDDSLGGTGMANPNADFAGVKVDPNVNPSALFGAEGHTAGGEAAAAGVDLFS